jgi:hypothetical protein
MNGELVRSKSSVHRDWKTAKIGQYGIESFAVLDGDQRLKHRSLTSGMKMADEPLSPSVAGIGGHICPLSQEMRRSSVGPE